MKFSILVPVYNVEEYVEECIQSVLSQTFEDYELILVDDGSTDCSGKICDSYAEKYSKIRVFHKPNAGLMHTRRFGISKACGEWCVFLDSDDLLEESALETINQYTNVSDCVIYGYGKVLNSTIVESVHDTTVIELSDRRQLLRKVFVEGGYNALWRKAVKADRIGKEDFSKYFHISRGEDLLQSTEILGNCSNVTFIPDILYKYRVNPDSITHSITNNNFFIDFAVQIKVLELIKSANVFLEEDYNAYRDHCLDEGLIDNLFIIANLDTTQKNKYLLYKQIKETGYYNEFLSKGYSKESKKWKRKVLFQLFQMNCYFVLSKLLKSNK